MKRIILVALILLLSFNSNSQSIKAIRDHLKKEKALKKQIDSIGFCLDLGGATINYDKKWNTKVADLLYSEHTNYFGYHVSGANKVIARAYDNTIIARISEVDYAVVKEDNDTLCTVLKYLLIEKYQGGGVYAEPYTSTYFKRSDMQDIYDAQDPGERGISGLKYASCSCIETSNNWVSVAKTPKEIKAAVYSGRAWENLLKRKYTEAINFCLAGLKHVPVDLFLLGNLAHGYLLSGKYDEAIKIYKEHKGKDFNNSKWELVVKADFEEFQSKGITNPNMDKVLKELGVK